MMGNAGYKIEMFWCIPCLTGVSTFRIMFSCNEGVLPSLPDDSRPFADKRRPWGYPLQCPGRGHKSFPANNRLPNNSSPPHLKIAGRGNSPEVFPDRRNNTFLSKRHPICCLCYKHRIKAGKPWHNPVPHPGRRSRLCPDSYNFLYCRKESLFQNTEPHTNAFHITAAHIAPGAGLSAFGSRFVPA